MSDCGAVDDIFMRHKIVPTAAEASALAVTRGCDLECGGSYRSLKDAVAKGLIKEADLDVALQRLFVARMKLGMFDPPERVRWAQIPYSVNDAPEHDRLARRVAQKSIVLLKNSGVLPLRKDLRTIAVVGPTADDLMSLLGNYNGTPSRPVTILAGIRNAVGPGTKVIYERGVDLVEGRKDPRAVSAIDTGVPEAGARLGGARAQGRLLSRAEPGGRARSTRTSIRRWTSGGTAVRRPKGPSRAGNWRPIAPFPMTGSPSDGRASSCRRCRGNTS